MREVKRYPLEIMDVQSFEIPLTSDLLSATYDGRSKSPVLWVRQDDYDGNAVMRMVTIYLIVASDDPETPSKRSLLPDGATYLGTVTMPSGMITMHFFEGS